MGNAQKVKLKIVTKLLLYILPIIFIEDFTCISQERGCKLGDEKLCYKYKKCLQDIDFNCPIPSWKELEKYKPLKYLPYYLNYNKDKMQKINNGKGVMLYTYIT